ncbi:Uncharacterized protein GBIM_05880 [Gryllus bimaculatus]|nr:Uncharacterized protein GBIM_05880 [Gryllus bimaculatus]
MIDENRDLNGHTEDEIKRQRTQYNGDQLFSNIWSSKWSIKDEHKLLSELGSGAANGGSPYYDTQPGAFPTVTTTSDMYDSISTMTQSQSTPVYTPPIGSALVGCNPPTGPGSLTPLAPITMPEVKLTPSGVLDPSMSPYQPESSTYNGVSTSTVGEAGSSPGLPLSLPADPAPTGAPSAAAGAATAGSGSPDPGSLTVLQPANNGAAAAVPYSAMLPSFGHYSTGKFGSSAVSGSVVPVSDYSYSSPYSQYTSSYGTYGYGAGGLLSGSSYYHYGNGVTSCAGLNQNLFTRAASCAHAGDGNSNSSNSTGGSSASNGTEARSPLAATRASSGASASSPTGSACMKSEYITTDLLMG